MTLPDPAARRRARIELVFGDVKDQSREYRDSVLAMPMHERLELVERLRQIRHGPDYAAERLLRVLTVVERERG